MIRQCALVIFFLAFVGLISPISLAQEASIVNGPQDILRVFAKEDLIYRERNTETILKMGSPAVEVLLQGLKSEDYSNFWERISNMLARFGPRAKAIIPDLISLLESKNYMQRAYAAVALTGVGVKSKEVEEIFIKMALSNKPTYAQGIVIMGLASFGTPKSIETLGIVLHGKSEMMREIALGELYRMGPKAAPTVPQLGALLKTGNEYQTNTALKTLRAIGTKEALDVVAEFKRK